MRILAATNRNPERDVEVNRFREDLFYRLNVIRVHLPPLRERREDILPLANFFLQRLAREHRLPPHRLSEEAIRHLEEYGWPGNVRELENILERACVLATADVLLPKDILMGSVQHPRADSPKRPVPSARPNGTPDTRSTGKLGLAELARLLLKQAETTPDVPLLASIERELILQALEESGQRAADAAKILGITTAVFKKKLKAMEAAPPAESA